MSHLVALTTTSTVPDPSNRREHISLWANYVGALEKAGLTAVLITPAHSLESARTLVAGCAGLVLSGGEDIDPSHYGEEPVPQLARVNAARDAVEFAALETALERRMPVLG